MLAAPLDRLELDAGENRAYSARWARVGAEGWAGDRRRLAGDELEVGIPAGGEAESWPVGSPGAKWPP